MSNSLSGDLHLLQPRWGFMLVVGLLLMFGGAYAATYAYTTSVVAMMMLGTFLLLSGIIHIIGAMTSKGTKGFFLTILTSLLAMLVGGWILYNPSNSMMALTWLFALFFLLSGIIRIIVSITYRHEMNWFWLFLTGVISLALGLIIYSHWPVSGLWIIGLFIGIDIFLSGWSLLLLSLAARRA